MSQRLQLQVTADISQFEKSFKKVSARIKKACDEVASLGANLVFATDTLKSWGSMAVKAAQQNQEAFKKIRAGTGATGEALNGLLVDFKKVNVQTTQSSEQIATALADLNTRLGISGEWLQSMTLATAEASRLTGQEMQGLAAETAKAMNAMGVSGSRGAEMLDKLFVASQNTGMGMTELATMTAKYSGVLQAAGLSLDQSIAMLSSFSNAGMNTKNVMSGITAAMNKFAKAGVRDAGAELNKAIEAIRGAATESKAAQIAVEVFGASGTAMAQAIRSGRFEVGELSEKLRNSQGAIQAAAKDSETFADSWARTQKSLMNALEPLGTALLSLGEKYVIPAVQWLGSFTASGNETIAMLGVFTVAIGPLIGTLGGLFSVLVRVIQGFASITFPVAKALALKGAMSKLSAVWAANNLLASATSEELTRAGTKLLSTATFVDKLKYSFSGLGAVLTGPGGLVLGLSALAAYLVGDYIVSTRRAEQETAAFRAEIEKLAQSLAALSDRELSIKIAGSQEKVQQLTTQYLTRKSQIDSAIDQERKNNLDVWSTRIGTYRSDESAELEGLKKQIKQEQERLMTALNEENLRSVKTYVADLQGKFYDQLKNAKTSDAARSLASGFVEQLGAKAKEFTAGSKAGQALTEAQKRINDAAQNYRPVINTGNTSPTTKTVKTPKTSVSKDDLLDRLRWQNSAGFLSDTDYQAALTAQFQKLTGGKGYETWSKDARSAYDELKRLEKSQASKAAKTLKWLNSAGFLSDENYAASLKDRLAGLTGGAESSKWTEEARNAYDELSRVLNEQANKAVEKLNQQFEEGSLTTEQYNQQIAALKTNYQGFSPITDELAEKMKKTKSFSETFTNGMTLAVREATASFEKLSVTVGTGLADGFARAIAYGEDLGESLKKLGQDIVYTVTKMLMLQAISSMFGIGTGAKKSANGNVFAQTGFVPFADGGIVGRPTLFRFAGGTGLMGEAGPEAIMPLERDSHGRLGVHASGAGGGVYAPQFNVTVNNTGGGDMSDEQAENMSRALRDAIDARVAEDLYNYRRMGYYGGVFA